MKKINLVLCSFAALVLVLSSCTMEKRHYSSGYNVQWKGDAHAKSNDATNDKIAVIATPVVTTEMPSVAELPAKSATEVNVEALATNTDGLESASAEGTMITVLPSKPIYTSEVAVVTPLKSTTPAPAKIKNQKEKAAASDAASPKRGGKSWLVALILCFFLGGLGIHRFYLGYTGIGILMLLTAGVFGVLWIIDFIRILIRSLEPKDGSYD